MSSDEVDDDPTDEPAGARSAASAQGVQEALTGVLALQLAQRRAMDDLGDPFGLSESDLLALAVLVRRGSVTVGTLAKELALTPGSASLLVGRLEKAGRVERIPGQSDRRIVRIRATATGEAAVEHVRDVYVDALPESEPERLRTTGAVLRETADRLVPAAEAARERD